MRNIADSGTSSPIFWPAQALGLLHEQAASFPKPYAISVRLIFCPSWRMREWHDRIRIAWRVTEMGCGSMWKSPPLKKGGQGDFCHGMQLQLIQDCYITRCIAHCDVWLDILV